MKSGALVLLLVLATPALADSPRIGLVLSGGGARGLAHIGVIRALEEQNIRIAAIAGTSMGAIVGALYASGRTPDELEEIALSMNWAEALDDEPARDRLSFRRKQDSRGNQIKTQVAFDNGTLRLPKGVVQGQNLQIMLQQQFLHVSHVTNFDDLPIPFRVVAGDLATGEAVAFSSGSLPTLVRASMSIPGLFAPVELDDRLLVDGGIANNLPVDVMQTMGVDHIIAVDIATPLYEGEELDSLIPIIEQLTTLLTFNQLKTQYALIGRDDILITPNLNDVNTADFDKIHLVIARGYEAIMANLDRLEPLVSKTGPARPVVADFEAPVISAIEINNNTSISDRLIKARVSQHVGEPLDDVQLRRDIETIYGYEYFESVQYEVIRRDEKNILQITTTERSWGKSFLGVSFELFTDTRADSGYNVGASYRQTGVTDTGGEWFISAQFGQDPAIHTDLYMPIDYEQRVFLRPYASYAERTFNNSVGNVISSRFRIDELVYGAFFGTEVSNLAVVGVGIERHDGDQSTFVGANPGKVRFDDRLFYFLAEYDTVNSVAFPHTGSLLRLRYDRVSPSQGEDYNLAQFSFAKAFPINRHSLIVDGRYRRASSDTVSRHLQVSLGGFKNLTGLHRDSLVDNNLVYLGISYLHRLDERSRLPVELPVFLGIGVEAGNVWARQDDIDLDEIIWGSLLMLGVDTPVGPLYLGYGRVESHDSAFYLRLGHFF